MDGHCPLSEARLSRWVETHLFPESIQGRDPFSVAHWDEIDPGWVMPWYAALRCLPHGVVPSDEFKVPSYGFDDAMSVFSLVRRLLPEGWPGVIEVVIPLSSSEFLMTSPPVLEEVIPDWWTPPLVYLLPSEFLSRMVIGNAGESYQYNYIEFPPMLQNVQSGSIQVSIAFRSERGIWAIRREENDYSNSITIIGVKVN